MDPLPINSQDGIAVSVDQILTESRALPHRVPLRIGDYGRSPRKPPTWVVAAWCPGEFGLWWSRDSSRRRLEYNLVDLQLFVRGPLRGSDDSVTDDFFLGTMFRQQWRDRQCVPLVDERKKDVLAADFVVLELDCLSDGSLKDLLRPD